MRDFSGDGKITQKDVLMGRGVIDKPPMRMMKEGGVTIEDTTKTIDVPTPKPFTNPIKTAINKIPSNYQLDKTKNMKKAQIPDKFKKKIAMKKIRNVAQDVFKRD